MDTVDTDLITNAPDKGLLKRRRIRLFQEMGNLSGEEAQEYKEETRVPFLPSACSYTYFLFN